MVTKGAILRKGWVKLLLLSQYYPFDTLTNREPSHQTTCSDEILVCTTSLLPIATDHLPGAPSIMDSRIHEPFALIPFLDPRFSANSPRMLKVSYALIPFVLS